MEANAKKLGMNVVLYESYPHGISDASPLIQKIKNASPKPDAIFPISYFTDAVLIVRALRQNHLDIPIVGGAAGYVIPDFKKTLGPYVNGILSADTSNYDHYGKIGKQYRKRYGKFMTHEAFENAVLVYTYAAAANHAGTTDPDQVAKALHSMKFTGYPFTGLPGGGINFNAAGANTMTYPIMVQWQNGELATVWPKNEATSSPHWK
jgi:branched-chain amino acid transport system substrate-binding protein